MGIQDRPGIPHVRMDGFLDSEWTDAHILVIQTVLQNVPDSQNDPCPFSRFTWGGPAVRLQVRIQIRDDPSFVILKS